MPHTLTAPCTTPCMLSRFLLGSAQARLDCHMQRVRRDASALDTAYGQPFAGLLPAEVSAPGAPVAAITTAAAAATGLPEACLVCAGTTGAPQGRLPATRVHPTLQGADWQTPWSLPAKGHNMRIMAAGCSGTLHRSMRARWGYSTHRALPPSAPLTMTGAEGGSEWCEHGRGRGRQRGGICGGGRGAAGRGGDVAGLHAGGQAAERRARGRCGDRRVQPPPGRCLARGCGLGLGLPYPSTRRFKSKGNPARDLSLTL